MYNVVFESDTGEKFFFGTDGGNVFDMDLGAGVSVDIGTSQGFLQVGESVHGRSTAGRTIKVKGAIYENIQKQKKRMRKVISPFSSGRIVFENEYYTRVFVKDAPTFSTVKNDGRFSMLLFAPFPFFYSVESKNYEIGKISPMFSFPVNYETPHKFGEKSSERYKNVVNDGDVAVPFSLFLHSSGKSSNIVVSNLRTAKNLKINGTINSGDFIRIYRDAGNVLRAELTSSDETSDVLSWIDESSELFELNSGENLISANDEEGGASLTAKIVFNPAVVALYES